MAREDRQIIVVDPIKRNLARSSSGEKPLYTETVIRIDDRHMLHEIATLLAFDTFFRKNSPERMRDEHMIISIPQLSVFHALEHVFGA